MVKPNGLVVKANALVEASYRLDLIEQRLILAAIVEARETQRGLGEGYVTIEATKFAEMFGMDPGSVYGQLKAAVASLGERWIVINDTDPETGFPRRTERRWITEQSYVDKAGRVQLEFVPKVVPYLTRLEQDFTTYQIKQVGGLSSTHAIRVYELLVQYLPVGVREIEVQWFRERLEITALYPSVNDLKKRVVDTAVEQINAHTDLDVSYEQRKTGRAVTHLIFTIRQKKAEKPKLTAAYIEKHALPGETWEAAEKRLKG